MRSTRIASWKQTSLRKWAIAALVAFAIGATQSPAAYAKKPKYGTIRILSNPSGLPLAVDGKAYGVTTTEYMAIDLEPGLHSVIVTLPNGQLWTREIDLAAGRIKCLTVNYRARVLPVAKAPCRIPPISISVPPTVTDGEIINYSASITNSGDASLNYRWTISPAAAKILSGPGTAKLAVDSTGLAGQRVIAKLEVDDGSGDPACSQWAQVTTIVPMPLHIESPAREFDVCRSCSFDDQKARLDTLAIELQNQPLATSYIIAYGGRTSSVGTADRLGGRARDYLITRRGIDESRVITINGGFREQDSVDLWIVQGGGKPPKPTPTLRPGEVRPASHARPLPKQKSAH